MTTVIVEPVKPGKILKGINILETIRKSFEADWFKMNLLQNVSVKMVALWERLFDIKSDDTENILIV